MPQSFLFLAERVGQGSEGEELRASISKTQAMTLTL